MCGIFGITTHNNSNVSVLDIDKIFSKLFILSESRGKEASGFALNNADKIVYYKTPFAASALVKSKTYQKTIEEYFYNNTKYFCAIGHSRLVTNGYEQYNSNNQPVIKNNTITIHNGIIVNGQKLWEKYGIENKISELDSELLPTLFHSYYTNINNVRESFYSVFKEIYGMTSTAIISSEFDNLFLATNNGSIYYLTDKECKIFIFASERYILASLIQQLALNKYYSLNDIKQLAPNNIISVNLCDTIIDLKSIEQRDGIDDFDNLSRRVSSKRLPIEEILSIDKQKEIYVNTSMEYHEFDIPKDFLKQYENSKKKIDSLRRCKKCILPETFPYIVFDENGICNYCHNYQLINFKGEEELANFIAPYISRNGSIDCLLPFSGGRDSSYVLHYVKTVLKMHPIAFSYDWGMITDLARRNQARLCGKLGVEHILISADIRKKRENIRKNVLAWLKHPNLGTVPLFMAGDKKYFYYANLLIQQNNLKLSILGENLFETTNFKSGFCGIRANFSKGHTYTLRTIDKIKMLWFYGKEYMLNPAYVNSSLLDTFDAFKSYYLIKHNNINIYNYLRWDENLIINTLKEEYDWEIDSRTTTTWRIGDGTAAFYNYIYYKLAGFTENDTFRSNQIREGMLNRDEALLKVNEENMPRWESIKWYCDTIGINFENIIKIINSIPKLY